MLCSLMILRIFIKRMALCLYEALIFSQFDSASSQIYLRNQVISLVISYAAKNSDSVVDSDTTVCFFRFRNYRTIS